MRALHHIHSAWIGSFKYYLGRCIYCKEEPSLKVSFFVISVHKNESKFQNTYCFLTGPHSNLGIHFYVLTWREKNTFKLGSSLGKHADETNTEVFTISSGGFVNFRMKIFRSLLVTIFKTLVIYGKFVENLLTI